MDRRYHIVSEHSIVITKSWGSNPSFATSLNELPNLFEYPFLMCKAEEIISPASQECWGNTMS